MRGDGSPCWITNCGPVVTAVRVTLRVWSIASSSEWLIWKLYGLSTGPIRPAASRKRWRTATSSPPHPTGSHTGPDRGAVDLLQLAADGVNVGPRAHREVVGVVLIDVGSRSRLRALADHPPDVVGGRQADVAHVK